MSAPKMNASLLAGYYSSRSVVGILATKLTAKSPKPPSILSSSGWISIQQTIDRSSQHASVCSAALPQRRLKQHFLQLRNPSYLYHNRILVVQKNVATFTAANLPLDHSTNSFQIRHYMSYRKKLALKGGKKIMQRLPQDQCKIEFCHTRYDLRDYEERSRGYPDSDEDMDDSYHNGIFTVKFDSNAIIKTAIEYYEKKIQLVRKELQYYNKTTKQWKRFPFGNIHGDPDIQYYKGKGSRPIPLRVKSEYQEYDSSDDEDGGRLEKNEKVIAVGEDKPKVMEILYILRIISLRLGRLQFSRTDDDKSMMFSKYINMGAPIPISDWLINQMMVDDELSSIVIRQPGALKHITTCFIEFDELWNHEKDPFNESDDEKEVSTYVPKVDVDRRGRKKKKKKRVLPKKKHRLDDDDYLF